MRLPRLATCALLVAALAIPATPRAADTDQIARAQTLLGEASTALRAAQDGETRLAALGRAVTAHEAALMALRAGLRAMALTERGMTDEITIEAGRLQRLLAALQSLSRAPASALLVVRGGPLEATRAAMLMAGIAPELDRRASVLGEQLQALQTLRGRQEEARTQTRDALATLQELRAETTQALGGATATGWLPAPSLKARHVPPPPAQRTWTGWPGRCAMPA